MNKSLKKYITIRGIQLKQCSEKTLTVLNTHMRDIRSQKTISLYTQTSKIRKKNKHNKQNPKLWPPNAGKD